MVKLVGLTWTLSLLQYWSVWVPKLVTTMWGSEIGGTDS